MLERVILHLARNPDFPEGTTECGYEIITPLDASGHLDAEAWRKQKGRCRVRRFWIGEGDRFGRLVHHPGGAGGATWKIDYDPQDREDFETGYRLDTHRFVANEYVSIRADDGRSHTFKIAQIYPVI